MIVRFAQNWFGPDAQLYGKSILGSYYELSDEWKDLLPPRAVIVPYGEKDHVSPNPMERKETLRDFDIDFAAARAENEIVEKALATHDEIVAAGKRRKGA